MSSGDRCPRPLWDVTPADGFPAVGDVLTIPDAGNAGNDPVELIDGSRQIVLDVAV